MLTNKLLKCIYPPIGFTKGRHYEIYLDRYGHYCVYDDNHDERHNPFNTDNSMFKIVDVNTNTESYKANDGVDNYMGEYVDIFKYCPYCGGEIEFSEVE